MRRRAVVALLSSAAVAWSVPVYAQQPAKVARIGYPVTSSFESLEARVRRGEKVICASRSSPPARQWPCVAATARLNVR
jgi:hypothetical protein